MWKFCFVFLIGSVLCSDDGINNTDFRKFTQEEDCSRAGGICLLKANCPTDSISETGKCPEQSGLGAVCCHSLSLMKARCQQLGGACMKFCPQRITLARANDCPEGKKCCSLVS